jgi:hypothetical protein
MLQNTLDDSGSLLLSSRSAEIAFACETEHDFDEKSSTIESGVRTEDENVARSIYTMDDDTGEQAKREIKKMDNHSIKSRARQVQTPKTPIAEWHSKRSHSLLSLWPPALQCQGYPGPLQNLPKVSREAQV